MQLSNFIAVTAAFVTTTFASPTSSPELSARATKCTPGQVYCGWWLIDQNGVSYANLAHPNTQQPHDTRTFSPSHAYSTYADKTVGWDAQGLRTTLCEKLGKCDFNNGDAWNSLWHCYGDWQVEPKVVCGGKNACAGPNAHCT